MTWTATSIALAASKFSKVKIRSSIFVLLSAPDGVGYFAAGLATFGMQGGAGVMVVRTVKFALR